MIIEFGWNWLRSRPVACFGTGNIDNSRSATTESTDLFTFPHKFHAN